MKFLISIILIQDVILGIETFENKQINHRNFKCFFTLKVFWLTQKFVYTDTEVFEIQREGWLSHMGNYPKTTPRMYITTFLGIYSEQPTPPQET